MSRIGKKPIPIPQGVKIQVDGATLPVIGLLCAYSTIGMFARCTG